MASEDPHLRVAAKTAAATGSGCLAVYYLCHGVPPDALSPAEWALLRRASDTCTPCSKYVRQLLQGTEAIGNLLRDSAMTSDTCALAYRFRPDLAHRLVTAHPESLWQIWPHDLEVALSSGPPELATLVRAILQRPLSNDDQIIARDTLLPVLQQFEESPLCRVSPSLEAPSVTPMYRSRSDESAPLLMFDESSTK